MADNLSDEQLRVSFAHEFFHAEQAGAVGDCAAPLGWAEGAATWAQTEVFPKNKLTHKFFFWSLSPDVFTLKNAGAPVAEGYHAWPFWYFLRKQYGATAIGEMFTLLGAGVAFDDAVRAAPGVDFGTVWKDFAVAMYNQTPVGEAGFPLQSFSAWDDYNDHPALPRDAKINLELGSESGPDPDTFRTKVATKPLGINYLDLNVIDQDVKEVTITNGFGPSGQVGVELWADTTSGWKRIDLSRESTKSFCFDTPDETFTHAIVAIPTPARPRSPRTSTQPSPRAASRTSCSTDSGTAATPAAGRGHRISPGRFGQDRDRPLHFHGAGGDHLRPDVGHADRDRDGRRPQRLHHQRQPDGDALTRGGHRVAGAHGPTSYLPVHHHHRGRGHHSHVQRLRPPAAGPPVPVVLAAICQHAVSGRAGSGHDNA